MGQRTQNCKAPLFQAHMRRPHAYGTAMHDDFGSLAVPYSTAAAVLLSFNTYHMSAASGESMAEIVSPVIVSHRFPDFTWYGLIVRIA